MFKIDSIYKAGTPITFQDAPGTGSKHVYIAKIRGGSEYVIVKFLSRVGTNNDCNCSNTGITTFEYWKMGDDSSTPIPEETTDNNDIVVSPNPATETINISVPSYENATVEILNTESRILQSIQLQAETTTVQIDNLKAGIYFLKINSSNGVVVKKLIKN
ncbi:MAG: T9SS type A sorting domain-containing protein [Bacteroidales bacterium]|nr:T9SS type A sorting domain-containing protein [Bacteroidales bacterium]